MGPPEAPQPPTLAETEPETLVKGLPARISKESINQLPLSRFEGQIKVVNHPSAVGPALSQINRAQILGFDTESRPSFRRGDDYPPTILQLADADTAWVFQLPRIGGLEPLLPILENPNIRKVGVAIHDDLKRLQALTPFSPAGFVDVNSLSRQLKITNTGLRTLVALILGRRISKGAQVTNWARHELTERQIQYAAHDAAVSRELFLALEALCKDCL